MNKFIEINYGNDWGIFVDIENTGKKSNCFNEKYTIFINDNDNDSYNDNYNDNDNDNYNDDDDDLKRKYEYQKINVKIINTIFVNLFVYGFLVYIVYFVL